MNVLLHRRRASVFTWWIAFIVSFLIAIAGTIAYGWTILIIMLVVNAVPDFPLLGGFVPVPPGVQKPKLDQRILKPGRVWLHNLTHSTELAFIVTAVGAALWGFAVPAGREVFFSGVSLVFHMAIERLFFDHYFPDPSPASGQ